MPKTKDGGWELDGDGLTPITKEDLKKEED